MQLIMFCGQKQSGKSSGASFVSQLLALDGKLSNTYSFATALKNSAIDIFGLDRSKVFGSDNEKNELCHIEWSNIAKLCPNYQNREGYMTNREFLQVFGSDVCRTIFDLCWINRCINDIKKDDVCYPIIDDCRFNNEVKQVCLQFSKPIIIKLNRKTPVDSHSSENGLSYFDYFYDLVIPNKEDISLEEKNNIIKDFLIKKGIINGSSNICS